MAKQEKQPPRLRLASDIDLSLANPECENCNGTGVSGNRVIDDPEEKGKKITVPVICKCVSRAGGVRRDKLDEFIAQAAGQLEDGTFARDMAKDIMGLPAEQQGRAILQLKQKAASRETDPNVRKATFAALRLLQN